MARHLNGTTDFLCPSDVEGVLPSYPFTWAIWFRDLAPVLPPITFSYLMSELYGPYTYYVLLYTTYLSGKRVTGASFKGGPLHSNTSLIYGTTDISGGDWHHVAYVNADYNDHALYTDGGDLQTSSTAVSFYPFMEGTWIGAIGVFPAKECHLAEAAVWGAALSADEVGALAKGYSPELIRPTNLYAYWPIMGRLSPEPDVYGSYEATVTGTTAAAHPPILSRTSPQVGLSRVNRPAIADYYRRRRAC